MALTIGSWDLPSSEEQMQRYVEWIKSVTPRVTAVSGSEWHQGFRSPQRTSPQVLNIQMFDSLAAAQAWAQSDELRALIDEMRGLGCSNITVQVWDNSPLTPESTRR